MGYRAKTFSLVLAAAIALGGPALGAGSEVDSGSISCLTTPTDSGQVSPTGGGNWVTISAADIGIGDVIQFKVTIADQSVQINILKQSGDANGVFTPADAIMDAANGHQVTFTATGAGSAEFRIITPNNKEFGWSVTCGGAAAEGEPVQSFLFRRMDRLLSDAPDRTRLVRKRAEQGLVDFNGSGGSGGDMNVGFGTSLQQLAAYGAGGTAQKPKAARGGKKTYDWLNLARQRSGGGGADLSEPVYENLYAPPPARNPFDVWVEGHYTTYDSDFGDGDFGVVYVGADYLVNDRFLIGLLAQFDWMSQTEGSDTDIDGFGWMAGPYVSAEIVNNVFFDARFAWGQSDNDATIDMSGDPFSGDFDTDRWLAQATLSGNYSRGGWRITPEISVAYIEEKQKTFDVSNGAGATTTIDATTLSLGRLTAGPEFAYRMMYGSLAIEPQLGAQVIWDFHAQGDEVSGMPIYDTGPRGAVEVGLGLQAENGVATRFGAKYDGIGTGGGLDAFNFNGWLNIPF